MPKRRTGNRSNLMQYELLELSRRRGPEPERRFPWWVLGVALIGLVLFV